MQNDTQIGTSKISLTKRTKILIFDILVTGALMILMI
jgi:hypothetical protein